MKDDLNIVLAVQALRAALYGFGAVLLGEVLATHGFSTAQVGLILTAMVAGMAVSSLLIGAIGPRLGARTLYPGLLLVMGVSGLVFALTAWLPALLVAGLTGTISTDPNESGPITTVEQGIIGQASAARRLKLFGRYNAVAYLAGAVGSLLAAAANLLQHSALPLTSQQLFLAFPVVGFASAVLAARVGGGERATVGAGARTPRSKPSRRIVQLSSLFALDAFGGGFITQAFIAYWLHFRFGAAAASVGALFFVGGLMQAGSSILAVRLAARFGPLRVMVFTHLPSNLLLAAVAFAPSLPVAIALLVARFALSQMDVPARQAFVAGMVPADERLGAAAYTNLSRYIARPFGPLIGGVLMRSAVGAPFFAGGVIKVIYDVIVYASFRNQVLLD
ncbi:MAG TPA: MFS transporter [Candidatus Dormibacteraeota bacterium]|nr:MFS transporter [Candidatus Dormibacteraeota bacterium]